MRPCGTAASRCPACPSVQVPIGREAYLAGFPELARSRSRPGPGIPALLVESAARRHGSLPPRPQRAASPRNQVQGQGFVCGRGKGDPMGGVRLSVRGRTLAGVRPPPQREAVDVEGAVGCSRSDRLEAEREAGRCLSFAQSCLSRKLVPGSGPVQTGPSVARCRFGNQSF